jgi:hypothetical protein
MDEISDDEQILRHIPGGSSWQAPGPRVTSANFQLRHDRQETGVSVTRLKITSPERLLEIVAATPDSRIAVAVVGEIRALGLAVVPTPKVDDPGHSEVQSDKVSLDDHASRKKLAKLFKFLD